MRNWVRSDMSGLGAGHVWEMPLESDVEAGYDWLTHEKAERSDMSGQSLWNPFRGPDMSDLAGVFGGRIDFCCIALYQLTQCISLDSTELLEIK
jgi:hypothetical protein